MKDYAVWNAIMRAHDILMTAETVSIETYREAMMFLDEAIEILKRKGKMV